MGGVGTTLREARADRGVELADVEAATKIRRRFLAAIENEAWNMLPGPAYATGFVRAYADFLGLDGARLAAEVPLRPSPPPPAGAARRRSRRRVPGAAVAVSLVLIAVIAAVGLLWTGGGSDDSPGSPSAGGQPGQVGEPAAGGPDSGVATVRRVDEANGGPTELSLTATAELWVCLLGEDGAPLVDGVVLPPGAEEGPFRSGSFTVSFGNGEVEMRIDGTNTDIPESASPLGYEIGPGGDLSPLSESTRPTCT